MKSILLSSPALQAAGYGVHSRQIAKWLFRVASQTHELDITTEPVLWGRTHMIVDPEAEDGLIGQILQAAGNKKNFYDVTIQCKLPNEWNPFLGDFNIGVTAGVETDKCNPAWIDCINRMNMIIVPSEFTRQTFLDTGEVKVPIEVIPECYPDSYDTTEPAAIDLGLTTSFNFLVVGQITGTDIHNDRKNLPYTVKWFSEVFAGNPDVGVILKTNSGANTQLDKLNVQGIFGKLLSEVSHPSGPKFYLLHGHMTDAEMMGMYTHPDIKAFVTFTHGEGFCCLNDTPVVTSLGLRRIDEITTGMQVLTHQGRYRAVTKTLQREYSGDMITVTPYNAAHKTVTLTPNHRVYVFDQPTQTYVWKPAGELGLDAMLVLPRPLAKEEPSATVGPVLDIASLVSFDNLKVEADSLSYLHSNKLASPVRRYVNADKNFGRLLGYFFAEGCAGGSGEIVFSLHTKEKETLGADIVRLMQVCLGHEANRILEEGNRLTIHFHNKILAEMFTTLCGKGARNKKLSPEILAILPVSTVDGFLAGTFLGDGYIRSHEISIELGTEEGVHQLRQMLLDRSIVPSFSTAHRIGEVRGTCYDNLYYRLRVTNQESLETMVALLNTNNAFAKLQPRDAQHESKGRRKFTVEPNGFVHVAIKTLKTTQFSGTVYNLSVEEDESYSTEDFVVHNCLPGIEAAACGLPIIATNWSGHLDFLNKGRFSKVDRILAEIPESRVDGQIFLKGMKWANPVEVDAKRRLQKFYEASTIPRSWAADLKKKIRENYSFEATCKAYSSVLDAIL